MAQRIELNEKYENFVHTQEYGYGEYFEQLDLVDKILEQVNRNHLFKGLSKYLAKNYQDKMPGKVESKELEENAKVKAKSLISGNYNEYNYLSEFNSKAGYKNLVKNAVSDGYVWKFRIEEPWHASFAFDEDRVFTYPFQHKFMILYTGQAKHIFFSKEGKWDLLRADEDVNNHVAANFDSLVNNLAESIGTQRQDILNRIREISENLGSNDGREIALNELAKQAGLMHEYRNPNSILEQGAIYAGNQHVAGDDEEDYDKQIAEKAIWFGFLDKAKNYPARDEGRMNNDLHPKLYDDGVVFEVELPTNWVAIKTGIGGGVPNRIESLEDCVNNYKSPRDMASKLDRNNEFVIPNSTGRLPIHYITGVWDKGEFPDTPHFMNLKSFVGFMEKKFPKRMPKNKKHIETSQVSKKDLEKLNEKFQTYKTIAEKAETLSSQGERIYELINNLERHIRKVGELEEKIDRLNKIQDRNRDENRELEYSKRTLKSKFNEQIESDGLRNTSRARYRIFSEFLQALNNTSISVNPSKVEKVNYVEHLEIISETDTLPGYKIAEEVREARKYALRSWENGEKQDSKQIISDLERDIQKLSSKLYLIQPNIEDLMTLLEGPLSSISDHNRKKVEERLLKTWNDAEWTGSDNKF